MTPTELRRRASENRAEAAELTADADRLRSLAAVLRGSLDPLLPFSQRVWVGPAAEDFESEVRRHSGELHDHAVRLIAIAGDLDRRAAIARRTATSLDTQAVAAEAAEAVAAAAGAQTAGAGLI